jgi:hypothetical protein
MLRFIPTTLLLACVTYSAQATATTVQVPGLDANFFAQPYYTCATNYYVSTAGSDSNPGTAASPWQTLAHAESQLVNGKGGQCVNLVPSSSSYFAGFQATKSGASATAGGYIVYRCETMNGCLVSSASNVTGTYIEAAIWSYGQNASNYRVFDGLNINGSPAAVNQLGFFFSGSPAGQPAAGSHHIWLINNQIHAEGNAGIEAQNDDYIYIIHNKVYESAIINGCGNGWPAQGSGISINTPEDIQVIQPGYTQTADDSTNPNPLIGSLIYTPANTNFHNVVEWNEAEFNYEPTCTTGQNAPYTNSNSDGNGIIMDTFIGSELNGATYPYYTLVAFNLAYNNGGAGIHAEKAVNVVFANNTSDNSGLSPSEGYGGRSSLDEQNGYNNAFYNNIATAEPVAPSGGACDSSIPYNDPSTPNAWNTALQAGPLSGTPQSQADSFSNNIAYNFLSPGKSCFAPSVDGTGAIIVSPPNDKTFNCTNNKCDVDPLFVNATHDGSETTPPTGRNFALQPTSPAVGYGKTFSWLYPTSSDAGACYHTLTNCQ